MSHICKRLQLRFNPFEPSSSGPPSSTVLTLPDTLNKNIVQELDILEQETGARGLFIVGEYGCGKTCLLRWLHTQELPARRFETFCFSNPRVRFYELADSLIREIGRKELAKMIWELISPPTPTLPHQGDLALSDFENYIALPRNRNIRRIYDVRIKESLESWIQKANITNDNNIANSLAQFVTSTVDHSYFRYNDYVSCGRDILAAEDESAPYLNALVKMVMRARGVDDIALLIDEFEELGLRKRLTRKAANDYIATMRRLINLACRTRFWLFLAMSQQTYDLTADLDPTLLKRVRTIHIDQLNRHEARKIIVDRLASARTDNREPCSSVDLYPFPDEFAFRDTTCSNPRRLVKTCHIAISEATHSTHLPFTKEYIRQIEDRI